MHSLAGHTSRSLLRAAKVSGSSVELRSTIQGTKFTESPDGPIHIMEDEYVDIVDKDDRVIGKELRSKVYRGGLVPGTSIRVVNIFIVNSEGKVLVPKRSMNRKIFRGCYDVSCGEHVQSGEDYDAAAVRGLKEELGVEGIQLECLEKLVPKEFGTVWPKEGPSAFMKIYKGVFDGPFLKYDRDGIECLNWFTWRELKEALCQDRSKFKYDLAVILEELKLA